MSEPTDDQRLLAELERIGTEVRRAEAEAEVTKARLGLLILGAGRGLSDGALALVCEAVHRYEAAGRAFAETQAKCTGRRDAILMQRRAAK